METEDIVMLRYISSNNISNTSTLFLKGKQHLKYPSF